MNDKVTLIYKENENKKPNIVIKIIHTYYRFKPISYDNQ